MLWPAWVEIVAAVVIFMCLAITIVIRPDGTFRWQRRR
jgi:hypothetical protein